MGNSIHYSDAIYKSMLEWGLPRHFRRLVLTHITLDSGKIIAIENDKRAQKICGKLGKTSAKIGKRKAYATFEVFPCSAGF